jgi:hypothetical protein
MDARAAIEQAKARGDRAFFERALDESRGVKALLQTLEQLGRLPTDFDPAPLMRLATHPHDEVRIEAVKRWRGWRTPPCCRFTASDSRTSRQPSCDANSLPPSGDCARQRQFLR